MKVQITNQKQQVQKRNQREKNQIEGSESSMFEILENTLLLIVVIIIFCYLGIIEALQSLLVILIFKQTFFKQGIQNGQDFSYTLLHEVNKSQNRQKTGQKQFTSQYTSLNILIIIKYGELILRSFFRLILNLIYVRLRQLFIRLRKLDRVNNNQLFLSIHILVLIIKFNSFTILFLSANMLNILLQRALDSHPNQPVQSQPIFTFSYSTKRKDDKDLNQIHKQTEQRKLIKTERNVQKGFMSWKSKTIQKLQKFSINNPQSNIASIWTRKTGIKINKKNQKVKSFQKQSQNQINIIKESQYIIRTSSPHRSLKSPLGKTLYLKYKQVQEQKINQKRRFSSLNSRSLVTQRTSRKSGKIFMEPKVIQCSIDESSQQKKGQTSNANFLKTIQYFPVSKEEIIQRRTEDMQNRKKNVRKTRQKFRKPIIFDINNSESFQNSCEQDFSLNEKNTKKLIVQKKEKANNFHIRFSTKRTQKKFQSYRPWSPIKTNPMHFDDQELMLQTFTQTIKRKSYEKQSQ